MESYNSSVNEYGAIKYLGTVDSSTIGEFLDDYGVTSGEFKCRPGNYFTIKYDGSDKDIYIAGCNIYKYHFATSITKNHIVCWPKSNLLTASMNSTNTTEGSYIGSEMNTVTIPIVNENLQAVFGDHLMTTQEYVADVMTSTIASAGYTNYNGASSGTSNVYYAMQATLLSEVEVFGSEVWSSSAWDVRSADIQLPIFRLFPWVLSETRSAWWLKAVASSASFCRVGGTGYATGSGASDSCGVRPRFCLG